jgi:hypothetical protein
MFNSYPSGKEIHFTSGTAVIVSYVSLFQALLVPTFIVIGIKERRARLAVHASNASLAEESVNN